MDYQKIAQEYMDQASDYWQTAFRDPEKADGLCTDSAEDFVRWCEKNGYEAYVLDLVSHEDNMGSHTVAIMGDGDTVIDFTMHQFDPENPEDFLPPYINPIATYEEFGWGVDGREAYTLNEREVPFHIFSLEMGYIPSLHDDLDL